MMNTQPKNESSLIISRLSMERCQSHLAHLHALMFLCSPEDLGLDAVTAGSVRDVMACMTRELRRGMEALEAF